MASPHAANQFELRSQAFQNLQGELMSALLLSTLEDHGLSRLDVLRNWEGYGLVEFSVGYARQHEQVIVRDPTAAEPWHVHIVGQKSKGWRKRFKIGCTLIAYPKNVTDSPPT